MTLRTALFRYFSWNFLYILQIVTCPPNLPSFQCGVCSTLKEQTNAKEPFYRGTDYRDDQRARGRRADAEVCRKHGPSQGTFYRFKSGYGGMELSDAARLKALEEENAKLKRLLADTMLDNVVLKALPGNS